MSRLKEKLARLHGKQLPTSPIQEDSYVTSSQSTTSDSNEAVASHEDVTEQYADSEGGQFSLEFDDPFAAHFAKEHIGLYTNEFGSFLLKRTPYPLEHQHGMYTLNQLEHIKPFLHRFFDDQPYPIDSVEQLLFFDLETTGLGTGTGNIPFMIGLAYVKCNQFIVEQAVIRHVAEERALLAYLHRLTEHYRYLVTYNGKTFDWPLIVNRYIMNGMREEIWQPKHIDLLHPSRSIWRNSLQSCKLSYIEEARLGITRIDDLPGAEAPDRYFKYLADQNPEHLFPVYTHNELDMLSLASLLIRFSYLLSDQDVNTVIQLPNEPEEMIRTGLWLEKMGLTSQCEQLYEVAIQLPISYAPTLYKLSLRDKQMGNEARAIFLWEKVVASDAIDHKAKIDCLVQLAIYYEHKRKSFSEALAYTEQALSYCTLLDMQRSDTKRIAPISKLLIDLEKRKQRLLSKMKR